MIPKVHNAIFLNPIIPPPPIVFSENIVIIGCSDSGPILDPMYIRNHKEATDTFGNGRLVDAYNEARLSGGQHIYLIRLGETLSEQETYDQLHQAYRILSTFPAHILIPLDAYIDSTLDFAGQLCDFLYDELQAKCVGIIGAKPREQSYDDFVTDLIKNDRMSNGFKGTSDGEVVDKGTVLSVVATEAKYNYGKENEYVATATATYGGMLASLQSHISPTNKTTLVGGVNDDPHTGIRSETISNLTTTWYQLERVPEEIVSVLDSNAEEVDKDNYEIDYLEGRIRGTGSLGETNISYKYSDLNSLALKRYVVFRYNRRRGYVPLRAATAALPGSPWQYIAYSRITAEILARLQYIAQDFIGEDSRYIEQGVVPIIYSELDKLVRLEQIQDYKIDIEHEDHENISFQLDIVPIGQIKSLRTKARFII